jgi:hypothetical protein
MSLKEKFRQIKKLPDWIYWVPARLLELLFILFYRFELIDPLDLCRDPKGFIVVMWHNRLMCFPMVFPRRLRPCARPVVSSSRDGQYIADFAKQYGVKCLRGSSSKRGAIAQLGAISSIRDEGKCIIFTPDGPRGPRYRMKAGPIHLASVTGSEVVPISINYSRCWSIRSWDGFQIPKPFSLIKLVIGSPIAIPPHIGSEEIEKYRQQVESELMKITVDPPSARRRS